MSAPNVNAPNEGIVGQTLNSVGNAVNYVSDTLQGNTAEAKKETGKEQAKGNVPGERGLGDRVSGAADAVSGKLDEEKYKGSAEALTDLRLYLYSPLEIDRIGPYLFFHYFQTKLHLANTLRTICMEQPSNIKIGDETNKKSTLSQPAKEDPNEKSHAEDRMWTLYLKEADKIDKARMESWAGDMEGILIFQDPAQVTVALLAQISLQLASSFNGSSVAPSLSPDAIAFEPSGAAVSANMLWLLSLLLSLTSALLATLVQQWARQYLQIVGNLKGAKDRAGIRAYMAWGQQRFKASEVVEAVPIILHASLFLFSAGLFQFIYAINVAVAIVVLIPVTIIAALYISAIVLSSWHLDWPYRTPLSKLAWKLHTSLIPIYHRMRSFLRLRNSYFPIFAYHNLPRYRECVALRDFARPDVQSRTLRFLCDKLIHREDYIDFFDIIPHFLRINNGNLSVTQSDSAGQTQFLNVWQSFFWFKRIGSNDPADLAWLRSLFAVYSSNVVRLPHECHLFESALTYYSGRNQDPVISHYARCLIHLTRTWDIATPPGDIWRSKVKSLCGGLVPSNVTLPGTEGGIALQKTLRCLTSSIFFPNHIQQDSIGIQRFLINRSQSAIFFASFQTLIAESHPPGERQRPLTPLGYYYIFDLVSHIILKFPPIAIGWVVNLHPRAPTVRLPAALWHENYPPAEDARHAYNRYLERVSDLGGVAEHFDDLRHTFPYAFNSDGTEISSALEAMQKC
ncbi:hypothetical protein HWV62_43220 [Athelia sp. TMB]|nr:hypothetical protein HWV62_43220 [Athelia sp. TMB]